tara:strand:- start:96 stop:449 length:354 start_codon:yes stop_codon:yes gene_type:complete
MLDNKSKKEIEKMISEALEKLDLKGGTMAFVVSVVIGLFAFYEKDSATEHSDINDKRIEDKVIGLEYKVNVLEQNSQSILINKTRIDANSEDVKELKLEIREGFEKIDDKLDKIIKH